MNEQGVLRRQGAKLLSSLLSHPQYTPPEYATLEDDLYRRPYRPRKLRLSQKDRGYDKCPMTSYKQGGAPLIVNRRVSLAQRFSVLEATMQTPSLHNSLNYDRQGRSASFGCHLCHWIASLEP
jgi:hypothetical protein